MSKSYWISDPFLQRYIAERIQGELLDEASARLAAMGEMAANEIDPRAAVADRQPPVLRNYDRNGNRIDQIDFHPAYPEMVERGYGSGLVWLHYDQKLKTHHGYIPYLLSFALGYMFAQAESGLYCPICMTDGVARVLLKFGSDEVKQQFFPRLTAQNVETLYQGAMFLTEKQGGSDVGANTTKAVKDSSGWKLYGDKWFCSNAGAEMILALARPEGAPEGTRGLGLFLVPKYLENGERNSYTINRLKDKLGVRSMPTGEITLNGAIAYPIGDVERGFHYMAEMINLSRLYNSVASIAIVRRAVYEAVSYAKSRTAFGKQIIDFPLMQHVLADMIVESRAAFHFVFEAIRLLDLIDSGVATPDDEKQLRLMTPLAKYYTAKLAVWAASESMEVLGGNGYIEEFVTARLLRDAQVLPIWEGATNILVLDAIRAMTKEESHKPLLASVERRLESTNQGLAERINNRKHLLNAELERLLREKKVFTGRSITDSLVKVVQASLLAADQHENGQDVTEYFIEKHFYGKVREELARKIVAFESKASF